MANSSVIFEHLSTMSTARFVWCRRLAWVVCGLMIAAGAAAQMARPFPASALRGMLAIGEMPEVQLNGRPARLSPGARLHDNNNLLIQPATVFGRTFIVNYTIDIGGELDQVWLLRPEEAAVQPWPRTVEQRDAWQFDPIAQRWTRP